MTREKMTSAERVMAALGHREPDRVPLFLLYTMHGARELGLTVREYFSKPEYVAEGQVRLREKYRNDCIYGFFYAPVEVEAWGGEVIYADDGPPNSGRPFIRSPNEIGRLVTPDVERTPCLAKVLTAIELMKEKIGGEAPIIGVAISPFSLPVMQIGFEPYIRIMYETPELFAKLMKINEEFCVRWANAQIAAGASAICYFDPVSSVTVIPGEMYLATGFKIARRTIGRINAPVAVHMASGRSIPILGDLIQTGAAAVATSCLEDLGEVKAACKGKIGIIGSLNGIEMAGWTPEQAENAVKESISKAAKGGGYILSDNHGEIPFQVPDEILLAISEAIQKWGRYPLDWINDEA